MIWALKWKVWGRQMNILDPNGKFMEIWNTVFDYFKLGILCLLFCLPVITAGASITAAFFVAMKMIRGEAPAIGKPYWSSFKENFKQATILWVVIAAVFLLLGMDWYLVMQMESTMMVRVLRAGIFIAAIVILMICFYVFPLLARYRLTNREIVKNAVIFAILNFSKNMLAIGLLILFGCLCDYVYQGLPIYLCVFPGIMLFYIGKISVKIFNKKIEKPEGDECDGKSDL